MAGKKNVFTTDLLTLYEALSNLNYSAAVNDFMLMRAIKDGEKWLKDKSLPTTKHGAFFLGTSHLVPDYWRAQRILKYHAYSARHASDHDLHELAREMGDRVQGQIICTVFECMELFFRKVGAKIHFQLRNPECAHTVRLSFRKSEFHKLEPKWQKSPHKTKVNTLQYFTAYMKRMHHGFTPFLEELAQGMPAFSTPGRAQTAICSLTDYYKSVEFFRHQTVHANGRYNEDQLRKLPNEEQTIIKGMTRRSKLFDEDLMLPSKEAAKNVIQDLSGLAFLLYEGLSLEFDMVAEWPDPRPTARPAR